MQQTERYKLNLIETGDPLSPAPLNENAEKLETAITAETAALDSRVTVLEAKYIVFGTFTGDGKLSQFIELGFTPRAILVYHVYIQYYSALALIDQPGSTGPRTALEIVENGFNTYNDASSTTSRDMNQGGQRFNYIAFA